MLQILVYRLTKLGKIALFWRSVLIREGTDNSQSIWLPILRESSSESLLLCQEILACRQSLLLSELLEMCHKATARGPTLCIKGLYEYLFSCKVMFYSVLIRFSQLLIHDLFSKHTEKITDHSQKMTLAKLFFN